MLTNVKAWWWWQRQRFHCCDSVGCGGSSHCHCHHCSSFCNTLSLLQNSNLAHFVCLNMRFGMLLQERNVKWKLYLVFINKGEKCEKCLGFHDSEYSGCGYMGC